MTGPSASPEVRPELSVVVCTFNRRARVLETLRHLTDALGALDVHSEVVVVDDASDDGTAAAVGDAGATRIVRHRRNRGASAARNSGALAATGEWLLFLDDDLVVDGEALAALWAARHGNAQNCLVPVVRNPSGSVGNANYCYRRLGERAVEWSEQPLGEVCYPVGAIFLLHRELFARTGGFDERIRPNYVEDDAFGEDLHRAGARVLMIGDAVVHHDQHGGDRSPENRAAIQRRQYHHRWVFYAVAWRGWARVLALVVGAPRSVQEAFLTRSTIPIRGYLRTIRRLPELLKPKPAPGPLDQRADVLGGQGGHR